MLLDKTLECPLNSKEIKPGNPKGYQPWIFFGKTDTEAPILWLQDEKSWLIGKDPDAGKDWGQEEKGVTEDEMVGWHHWLNGRKFEQIREMVKDRKAWCAAVLWVAKTWIQVSDWTITTATMDHSWYTFINYLNFELWREFLRQNLTLPLICKIFYWYVSTSECIFIWLFFQMLHKQSDFLAFSLNFIKWAYIMFLCHLTDGILLSQFIIIMFAEWCTIINKNEIPLIFIQQVDIGEQESSDIIHFIYCNFIHTHIYTNI